MSNLFKAIQADYSYLCKNRYSHNYDTNIRIYIMLPPDALLHRMSGQKRHGSHTEGSRSLDVYPSRLCLADVGNHFTTNLDLFNNF